MELRDMVLSTLEELDARLVEVSEATHEERAVEREAVKPKDHDDEVAFLKHTKERLEVLFEGLKSSEIKAPEQKLELTLRYLQLLLAQVDDRLAEKSSS